MAKTLGEKIILSEELVSSGFKVDLAIATTYSLDLEYLLSTTAALGLLGDMDDLLKRSPYYQMEAIQRSNKKMFVFCNASSIYCPKKDNKLFPLLEDCIKPVCLSKSSDDIVNFHAKVWIIKETSEESGASQIKVIVSSRNLSPSSEINAACVVTGQIGERPKNLQKTRPLIDFVAWLKDNANCSRKQRNQLMMIQEDLNKVNSWNTEMENTPKSDFVESVKFIPLGIGDGYNGDYCMEMFAKSCKLLVVSPFVDSQIESELWGNIMKRSDKRLLITREEQLSKSVFDSFDKREGVYVVKEGMHGDYTNSDIHAKMYFLNSDGINHLLLGSANATHNGFRKNIEFFVDIVYKPYIISYEKFRDELITNDRDCMFERLVNVDTTTVANSIDDSVFRQAVIFLQQAKATVVEAGGKYSLEMTTKKVGEDKIFIWPLHKSSQRQQLSVKNVFCDLTLAELSELFVVRTDSQTRIVKIPVKNLPRTERDNAIKNSVIKTKEDFIDYLGFLLSETPDTYILQSEERKEKKNNSNKASGIVSGDFYEQMLRLTVNNPKGILDIKEKISGLRDNVIPDGFTEVYAIFEQIAKQNKHE